MSEQEKPKLDLASIFPSKGDPRRPPEWYGRALLYAVIAVYLGWFAFSSWGKISYIVLDIVIALFLSLSVEPLVVKLIQHGWRRGAAAVTCLVVLIVIILALIAVFGNLFVQQMISMVKQFPELYNQLAATLSAQLHVKLPEMDSLGGEILKGLKGSTVTDFAGQALNTAVGMLSSLLDLTTALMVAFYISIAGPRLRRSLCQWMAPQTQRKFLLTWTVVQGQISGFLFSRSILAACSATCTAIFLMFIKVPYWLPLALFSGVVSQFVPTIGTYIGGALPVLFAWGERGIWYAVGVVVFITIYQQIENLILSPKVSERTMDLNPCVAFLSVLFFGSIFGALGAFLALPLTASLQVLFKVATKRYPLVDMPLMQDPEPNKKSKFVATADALNEHVFKPVGDHMPRTARGSSAHIDFDSEIRDLQRQVYDIPEDTDKNEDSPTIAIPKDILDKNAGTSTGKSPLERLKGVSSEDSQGTQTTATAQTTDSAQTAGTTRTPAADSPRKAWRTNAAQGTTHAPVEDVWERQQRLQGREFQTTEKSEMSEKSQSTENSASTEKTETAGKSQSSEVTKSAGTTQSSELSQPSEESGTSSVESESEKETGGDASDNPRRNWR